MPEPVMTRTAAIRWPCGLRAGLVASVLAMASYPTFDPNRPGQASLDARLNRAAGAI